MSEIPWRRWPVYTKDAAERVNNLVASGRVFDYSGAEPVTHLEQEFARLHGDAYVVSFNSGTSALFAAFAALGLGAGDEVLVPNITFLASASPLLWLGATPVLVDSDPNEPSVGLDAVRAAITPRSKAVVATHLFGNPVDVVALRELSTDRGLALIEDCSHAHASFVGRDHVGTFGDAAIYSIGSTKMISGGHGGVLVTRNPRIRDIAMLIGHFKPRTRTDVLSIELRRLAEFGLGGNLRLSPLAAALALDHLRRLNELSRHRQANVEALDTAFDGPLRPVRTAAPRVNLSHFDVVYRVPPEAPPSARDALVRALNEVGVIASAPSTRPLNRVLRAIAADFTTPNEPLLQRLQAFADTAPGDGALPSSTGQHDRMISVGAGLLHDPDCTAARYFADRAAPVLASHSTSWAR